MSHYDDERIYELLPAVYRLRDAELGHPLRDLIEILAGQGRLVEQDIARLYENWFIETCDNWLVPYVADLLGVEGIHVGRHSRFSRRAEVANTISYRRRKGTAAVLEQLARDVTGWPARVVEFFELLSTTQYLNHLRPHSLRTPDLRLSNPLEHVDGPFDTAAHTAEVRRIPPRRGRFNIPSVGLYVWRLVAYPLRGSRAREVDDGTGLHFTFSPLGNDAPLFHQPQTETSPLHIAEELNVPVRIRRRDAHERPEAYYGEERSIAVAVGGVGVPLADVQVCNLAGFVREPDPGRVAIDPVLGRLSFAPGEAPAEIVQVFFGYGFSDDIGGGPYERAESFITIAGEQFFDVGAGQPFASVGDALAQWVLDGKPSAVVLIHDSDTYEETLAVDIPADRRLEIRAANERRPVLLLGDELTVTGSAGSAFEINGLLIADEPLRVSGEVDKLAIRHTTLVPGRSLDEGGTPLAPSEPSLIVESGTTEAVVERSILGALRIASEAEIEIRDSIVDANDRAAIAYGAPPDGTSPGGSMIVSRCTIVGTVATQRMRLAENTLFLGIVTAERRQEGCVRFSYVPHGSRVPRRYRCQPVVPEGATAAEAEKLARRVAPRFTSLLYGDPAYGQLDWRSPKEVLRGAEDGSEMGAFSSLEQPQREDALRARLNEYLPVGLEAGILFAT